MSNELSSFTIFFIKFARLRLILNELFHFKIIYQKYCNEKKIEDMYTILIEYSPLVKELKKKFFTKFQVLFAVKFIIKKDSFEEEK